MGDIVVLGKNRLRERHDGRYEIGSVVVDACLCLRVIAINHLFCINVAEMSLNLKVFDEYIFLSDEAYAS